MIQPLPSQDQNGPDIYYKVFWRRMDHDTDYQYESLQDSGNIGMAVIHIKPEFYYTKYQVKVQVRFLNTYYQINIFNYFFLHNLLMFVVL